MVERTSLGWDVRRGVVEVLEDGTMRAWRPLRLSRERQRKDGPSPTFGGLGVGASSWLLVDGGLLASFTVSEWVKWARRWVERGEWAMDFGGIKFVVVAERFVRWVEGLVARHCRSLD